MACLPPEMRDVRLLVVTPIYPYPAQPTSGMLNERSVAAFAEICSHVEVLSPRPWVPPGLERRNARWQAYSQIPRYELRSGIDVHRPGYVQAPGIGGPFWLERMAFAASRRLATRLHGAKQFDAILSFDLLGGGGLAWRLGRELGLFAAGWATGGDVRVQDNRAARQAVIRALRSLDLVFYQSSELMEVAAGLMEQTAAQLDPGRNVVLARGIPAPPALKREEWRVRWRSEWSVADGEVLVVYIGRITRAKGAYELLAAAERSAANSPALRFVVIGAREGFDESAEFARRMKASPALEGRFTLLPACPPSEIWGRLCAADIVAFPSHAEGMPNGVLEALVMELPVVAFGIPAVVEIDPRSEAILAVPPLDAGKFADALEHLARSPEERRRRGVRGRERVMADFMIRTNAARAVARIASGLERQGRQPAPSKGERRGRLRL